MRIIGFFVFLLLVSSKAVAEQISCDTIINGKHIPLAYDSEDMNLYDNYGFREIFLRGWGKITCPSFITLRHLTPELNDHERAVFCLNYDKKMKTYTGFTIGERNAYLECQKPKKTFCERVNESKDAAIAITGVAAGAAGGATLATAGTGVTAVLHSSGAAILTGAGGYIAGTLATIGATGLAILTSPITIGVTTISVVAVGGAVYICKE